MEIYYNAKIYRNDDSAIVDTAMAVENGKIKYLGTDADLIDLAGKDDKLIDLKGGFVLPGFVDSHLHFLEYANEKHVVDLTDSKDKEHMLSILRDRLPEALEKGKPLRGSGFNQNYWEDSAMPVRSDLDALSTEIPIAITRTCHHVTVCNTPALELCGMEGTNPDGILREDEQNALLYALPKPTVEELKELITGACCDAASKGITEVQTDDLQLIPSELYGNSIIEAYRELSTEGKLSIRVYEQCNLPSMERLEAFLSDGYMTGQSFGNFTIGPLKLLGDGALGARSAAMKDPYIDDPENHGILNFKDDEMQELVSTAHKAGMQIAIHGIGDKCIEQILDAFEKAIEECPRTDHRHGIVHCQITRPETLERMKEYGVMAYIQPVFLKADQHIVEDRIGKALTLTSYDWRTMTDMGILLAGGSDCPVEPFDILPNMQYAVTCADPGKPGWYPEKGLTMEEAIRLFTSDGSYASFSEMRRGKLIPGYDADFTVLDRNILEYPSDELCKASVLMTFVGGKRVY